MAEIRDIKYVAREFSDYRQELIEFAKNKFAKKEEPKEQGAEV